MKNLIRTTCYAHITVYVKKKETLVCQKLYILSEIEQLEHNW